MQRRLIAVQLVALCLLLERGAIPVRLMSVSRISTYSLLAAGQPWAPVHSNGHVSDDVWHVHVVAYVWPGQHGHRHFEKRRHPL